MGQPIEIKKGSQKMTIYGRAQLAVMQADGWKLAAEETPAEPTQDELWQMAKQIAGENAVAKAKLDKPATTQGIHVEMEKKGRANVVATTQEAADALLSDGWVEVTKSKTLAKTGKRK
jgi:hypothetical protein